MQQCVSETTDTLRGGHCLARERSVGGVGRVGRQEPIDGWYQTPKFTIQPTSLALVLLHDQTCNARCHCGHRIAHRPHEDLTRATRGAYGKRPLGSDPPIGEIRYMYLFNPLETIVLAPHGTSGIDGQLFNTTSLGH